MHENKGGPREGRWVWVGEQQLKGLGVDKDIRNIKLIKWYLDPLFQSSKFNGYTSCKLIIIKIQP